MPRGFFCKSEVISKPTMATVPRCGACGLLKTCNSPKMEVAGHGRRSILIIGEAPGQTEDEQGKPFVGKAGKLLWETLSRLGVERNDCWTTNALICRPPKNRTPTSKEIEYCRPNIVKTIRDLQPEIIIPLGGPAVESLIGWLWRKDTGGISRWAGFQIPSQRLNAWICPTYHPSYVLRSEQEKYAKVVTRLFEQHLTNAVAKAGRPWTAVFGLFNPSQVKRIHDPIEAAKEIRGYIDTGYPSAIDYETNMLKPDSRLARIISCSISDGSTTIAYPWRGEAIAATSEFWLSDIPKIASNLKYEDRWTRRLLKHGVRNWFWDTMNNAHITDNRPSITGLKFQAFVHLGVDSYDEHIQEFLRSGGSNTPNQAVQEIEINQLLTYNGLDSLLEWHVAAKQIELIGTPEQRSIMRSL